MKTKYWLLSLKARNISFMRTIGIFTGTAQHRKQHVIDAAKRAILQCNSARPVTSAALQTPTLAVMAIISEILPTVATWIN